MLSRALSLAAVTLLIGCFAAPSGVGAGAKSRGRQEPFPAFRGYLQRLPQGPARPAEDGVGRIAAGLPAPALYDQQRHGLAAQCLPDLQWRERHPQSGEAGSRYEACRRNRSGRPAGPQIGICARPGSRQAGRRCTPAAASRTQAATPSGWRVRARRPTRQDLSRLDRRRHQAAIERGPDGRKLTAKQRPEQARQSREAKNCPMCQGRAAKARTGDGKRQGQGRNRQGRERQARWQPNRPAKESLRPPRIEMPKESGGAESARAAARSGARPSRQRRRRLAPQPPVVRAAPSAAAPSERLSRPPARPSAPVPSEPPAAVTASAPPPAPPCRRGTAGSADLAIATAAQRPPHWRRRYVRRPESKARPDGAGLWFVRSASGYAITSQTSAFSCGASRRGGLPDRRIRRRRRWLRRRHPDLPDASRCPRRG